MLQRVAAFLQHHPGGLEPQKLDRLGRRLAGLFAKDPAGLAWRQRRRLGQFLNRQGIALVLPRMNQRPADAVAAGIEAEQRRELRLAARTAAIDHQEPRNAPGELRAMVVLDQRKGEVDRRGHAGRGPNPAVITGASSGIGAVYPERFAARGQDLILVARRGAEMQSLADRLAPHGVAIQTVVADLSDPADLRRIEAIPREDDAVETLVNNAGVGGPGALAQSDVDAMEWMVDLNVTAAMRLSYAVAPGFVARGRGTIINISSIVAIAPEVLNGVYGGSKAFVLAFSRSLAKELTPSGVQVQVVLPGATGTAFWETVGIHASALPDSWVMTPETLVDAALQDLDAGRFASIPSLQDEAEWQS